jgi:fatty-acyl-CoA synthase
MQGLMQHAAMTVDKILVHARQWHGTREVVTRSVEGPIVRTTYAQIHDRARQVSAALLELGVKPGDRVATLAWNTARHMEAWYGIAGIGAIYHTLNPRLHPEQMAWIINHAEDTVLFADSCFAELLKLVLPGCPSVKTVIYLSDADHLAALNIETSMSVLAYEGLIAGRAIDAAWGGFDEETACGLCYTSGTTGDPKGVLYSHRSNTIHTFMTLQADVMGVSSADTILAIVPMFHANAWGLAFSGPAVGAKIVMPGMRLDGASVYELLESEAVTFSAAVPTVWQGLLGHLQANNLKLSTLKKVVIGGSAVPESLIRAFHEDYGVEVIQGWGMTETSPVGTLSTMTPALKALPFDEQVSFRLKQGRPPVGVELKIVGEDGAPLPWDGEAFGRLMIRGANVAKGYFKGVGGEILDAEGFFDTGDIATIDPLGFMQITDRAKDVIKSGGEWISSIDVENVALGNPKVALAAVIGVAHPKWAERPLLLVKLKPGERATKGEILKSLEGKIAKWWMPDDVLFVDDIPLGPTGKIDKKLLRARLADYRLPEEPPASGATVALAAARDPVLVAPERDAGSGLAGLADLIPPRRRGERENPFSASTVGLSPVIRVADGARRLKGRSAKPVPPGAGAAQQGVGEAVVVALAALAAARVGAKGAEPVEPDAREAAQVPGTTPSVASEEAIGPAVIEDVSTVTDASLPPAKGWPTEGGTGGDPSDTPVGSVETDQGPAAGSVTASEGVAHPVAEPTTLPQVAGQPDAIPQSPAVAGPAAARFEASAPSPEPMLDALSVAEQPAAPPADPITVSFRPLPPTLRLNRRSKSTPSSTAQIIVVAALALSALPAVLVIGGAVGVNTGLLNWTQGYEGVLLSGPTPQLGWAPAMAVVSLMASLLAMLAVLFGGWRSLTRPAALAVAISVLTLVAWWAVSAGLSRIPPIHDVSSDWGQPLVFSDAAMAARAADKASAPVEPDPVLPVGSRSYSGRRVADINSETCLDARPALLNQDPAQAYQMTLSQMVNRGLMPTLQDPAGGRLEATAKTFLYGFRQDIVVRILPATSGSRVDARSVSRLATPDLGANCRRVSGLLKAIADQARR